MKYRREIDGLRALAVIPVILFHAGFKSFSGGFVGVDVFFVISGYLITTILITEMEENRFSLIKFYERRARRILPALFFVLLCCLPFAWFFMLPSAMKEFSQSMIAVPLFASNFLFWHESGYFDTSSTLKPLLHTWSLAVEEQYYVFFPLFLMAFWKLGKSKLLSVLIIVLLSSLLIAYWGVANKPDAAFYLLPFRTWELLIGACTGFYLYNETKHQRVQSSNPMSQTLGLLGIALIVYPIITLNDHSNSFRLYALVPAIGAALIILFAAADNFAGKVLGAKLVVGIGLISYSAYLWHQPIFAFARHASDAEPSQYTFAGLSLITLLLAWGSWKFVETPFRDKHNFNQKRIFTLSIIGSLIAIVIGLAGTLTQGYLSRYSLQDQYLASLNANEAGKYVEKRFKSLTMKKFDLSNNKTKVLIIGDSYAEDLVNAMFESSLNQRYQFSTRHINKNCGNLFIDFSTFKSKVNPQYLLNCEKTNLYQDMALRNLMQSADEIWLSSAWQAWQVELLPDSIKNINLYRKKIKVYAVKDFGHINIKQLLALEQSKRAIVKNRMSDESIYSNNLLREKIAQDMLVDLPALLCGKGTIECPIFNKNNELLSYDGGHLTKAGARLYGDLLKENYFSLSLSNETKSKVN